MFDIKNQPIYHRTLTTYKVFFSVKFKTHDLAISCLRASNIILPSRHLTSVGRQIDVRLRRHNDVGFRLILKVCLTSKTDVILTSKTDVILTSEKTTLV